MSVCAAYGGRNLAAPMARHRHCHRDDALDDGSDAALMYFVFGGASGGLTVLTAVGG